MRTIQRAVRDSRIGSAVEQRPTVAFVALALGISWSVWIPLFLAVPDATSLAMIPGAFGPAVAAVLVTWLRGTGVRAWLADALEWRVGARWYAFAVGFPLALAVAVGVGFVVVAGEFDATRLTGAALTFPLSLVALALVGGGQEEFGWRGFALPRLQDRFDALTASVVVGVVWAVWHLPAFAFGVPGYTGSVALYGLLVVGISIVLTWLYNATGGSVLLAMLVHGGINAAPSVGAAVVPDPTAVGVAPTLLLAVPVWLVAIALLARNGRATLSPSGTAPSGAEGPDGDGAEVAA